jgi:cobalt/nickel transport system permease protein
MKKLNPALLRYTSAAAASLFVVPGNALAMHISEGLLPFNWAALWFTVAIPFVGYGLYRLKKMSEVDLSF